LANLKEAFLVFITLTIMALFNVGQLWEGRRISAGYVNWELTKLLDLDEQQMKKIQSINAVYEYEMAKVYDDKSIDGVVKKKKTDQLVSERNRQIMDVFNERQQKVLYTYCTDLLFFNKMFE
jgi:hypothetical protein